ncbi:MAG: hypothetical protein JRM90_08175 [Nitrososphaerota archaeon]|nr:hypothetical protein [Nitrososphaerota archaeon]MDG7021872.1 hypothetical protein [Nitrososphaerota archaeon]
MRTVSPLSPGSAASSEPELRAAPVPAVDDSDAVSVAVVDWACAGGGAALLLTAESPAAPWGRADDETPETSVVVDAPVAPARLEVDEAARGSIEPDETRARASTSPAPAPKKNPLPLGVNLGCHSLPGLLNPNI